MPPEPNKIVRASLVTLQGTGVPSRVTMTNSTPQMPEREEPSLRCRGMTRDERLLFEVFSWRRRFSELRLNFLHCNLTSFLSVDHALLSGSPVTILGSSHSQNQASACSFQLSGYRLFLVILPFVCFNAGWIGRKTLVPNVDPQSMHHALYSFQHFLGLIPAVLFERIAYRPHQGRRTLSILKHQSACPDLAGLIAVQHCSLRPNELA